jgi:hypothetical protein
MHDSYTTQEQAALPFLFAALQIDQAIQHETASDYINAALDHNVALWLYFKNLMQHTDPGVAAEFMPFLVRASKFMVSAATLLRLEADKELLSHVVSINLNMSELLLRSPSEPLTQL